MTQFFGVTSKNLTIITLNHFHFAVSALEHNTWFTKLRASGNSSKLNSDICDRILGVVAKSISLQELHLSTIGARWDFGVKLSQAMNANPLCKLQILDFSCNFLEDKGVIPLGQVMAKLPKGMHHLNLSHCSLSTKGLNSLSQSLANNRMNTSTLTYLNLCGNTLKDDLHCLNAFLAQPNVLAILDLSSTEIPLDQLFPALVRGCTNALTHLNLSRNHFSTSKKTKDVTPTFKQFFASTLALQYLNMSFCKIPPEGLKNLLLGKNRISRQMTIGQKMVCLQFFRVTLRFDGKNLENSFFQVWQSMKH